MGRMGGMPDINSLLNDPEVLAAFQVKQLNVAGILVRLVIITIFFSVHFSGPGSGAGFPRRVG